MKKLFALKEWLTLPEAARHLSLMLDDSVSEGDVLRLGLDGHLKLSVNLVNHAVARAGKIIPLSEAKYVPGIPVAGHEPYFVLLAMKLNDRECLVFDKHDKSITGTWDLPMLGAERLDVEHKYQAITGGPAVTLMNLEGAFVASQDGQVFQLQETLEAKGGRPRQRYPAGSLPEDSVLVVRTQALRDFEDKVSAKQQVLDRPLHTRERRTLLVVIAALCDLAKITPGSYGAAKRVAGATDRIGAPVDDSTIGAIFKQIPEALEARMK